MLKAAVVLTSQELPRLLWNLKFHSAVNSPPFVSILSHMHPIHDFPNDSFKVHINAVFFSKPTSLQIVLRNISHLADIIALLVAFVYVTKMFIAFLKRNLELDRIMYYLKTDNTFYSCITEINFGHFVVEYKRMVLRSLKAPTSNIGYMFDYFTICHCFADFMPRW
jgi:hypothetical protein